MRWQQNCFCQLHCNDKDLGAYLWSHQLMFHFANLAWCRYISFLTHHSGKPVGELVYPIKSHWHYSGYRSDGFDAIYFFMELLPLDHLLSLFFGPFFWHRSFIAYIKLWADIRVPWSLKVYFELICFPYFSSPVDSRPIVPVQNEDTAETEGRSIFAEEDGGTSLWNGIAKRGPLALCTPFLIALLFLIDVSMDFKLAASHWSQGNPKWAAYTFGVVVLSLFIVDALSVSFYFDDQQNHNKTWWLEQDKLHVRPWFYLLHFIFCGRIVRYDIFLLRFTFVSKLGKLNKRHLLVHGPVLQNVWTRR